MDNFKTNSVKGISWTLFNQFILKILSFIFSVVMARLIEPEAFGLIGMITIFSGFIMIFAEFGLGSAIIKKQDITKQETSSLFWLNVFIAFLFYIIFFFSSTIISEIFEEKALIRLTKVLTLGFILGSFIIVPDALLKKELKFKQLAIINITTNIIANIIGIALALFGYGIWAIVANRLSLQLIKTFLLFTYTKWFPCLFINLKEIKNILRFGTQVMLNNTVTYWARNLDNFLIGKILGSHMLGIYTKSYSIMMLPIGNLTRIIVTVMYPSFSSIQNNKKRIKQAYLKITQAIALIAMPIMLLISLLSRDLVLLTFGSNWSEMIIPLKILCIAVIPQLILSLNGSIYLTLNRPDIPLKLNLFTVPIILLSFVIGIKTNGLIGLTYAYLIANIINFIPTFYFAAKLINLSFLEQFKNLSIIFVGACLMLIVTKFINNLLILEQSMLLHFLISLFSGITFIIIWYYLLKPLAFVEILKFAKIKHLN